MWTSLRILHLYVIFVALKYEAIPAKLTDWCRSEAGICRLPGLANGWSVQVEAERIRAN